MTYTKEQALKAYEWLMDNHKWVIGGLRLDAVVKVNPKTRKIDDYPSKNTLIEYWLETGSCDHEVGYNTHDPSLDCGGASFEEALVKLARGVKRNYGKRSKLCGEKNCKEDFCHWKHY